MNKHARMEAKSLAAGFNKAERFEIDDDEVDLPEKIYMIEP